MAAVLVAKRARPNSTNPENKEKRKEVMYFSLIISFLFLLGIIIAGLQNSIPLELKFMNWTLQISSAALILFSSLIGGAIVAILALPRLARKSLDVKRLNREIYKLKEKALDLEK